MSFPRTRNLLSTSVVGVSAIVGGGILVLGGAAIRDAGPAALLAFAINGLIALITATMLAELAARYPDSGGIYTYAKKVVSLRFGFAVGWVLWFAHILAALLYALGFSAYLLSSLQQLGLDPDVFGLPAHQLASLVATVGTAVASSLLLTGKSVGDTFVNLIKLFAFAILIGAGMIAIFSQPASSSLDALSPFAPFGIGGILAAMGITFIAFQGFEVIAAVAGEVREPERTLPLAMRLALLIAIIVYIPLTLVVLVAGAPTAIEQCASKPTTCIATISAEIAGPYGYWLVTIAALAATFSALYANLLASSRVARQMAGDRTVPRQLAFVRERSNSPMVAISLNLAIVIALCFFMGEATIAGAAASFVFLICYSLCYLIYAFAEDRGIFEHMRGPLSPQRRKVLYAGASASLTLCLYQGFSEPLGLTLVFAWLSWGLYLYFRRFALRAEALDSYLEASDDSMLAARGKAPLILVPVANPRSAPALVSFARTFAPFTALQLMFMRVISDSSDESRMDREFDEATNVLRQALRESREETSRNPELLITVASNPWREIARVAVRHHCDSVILGFRDVPQKNFEKLEGLLGRMQSHAILLKAEDDWRARNVRKILIPVGGKGRHDRLRARVMAAFEREGRIRIDLLKIIPESASDRRLSEEQHRLRLRSDDEARAIVHSEVLRSDNVAKTLVDKSADYDLLVLGITSASQGIRAFGKTISQVATRAKCATVIIGH